MARDSWGRWRCVDVPLTDNLLSGGLSRGYIDSGRRLARVPVRFMPAPRAGACAPTYKRVPPPRRPGLLRVRVTVRAPAGQRRGRRTASSKDRARRGPGCPRGPGGARGVRYTARRGARHTSRRVEGEAAYPGPRPRDRALAGARRSSSTARRATRGGTRSLYIMVRTHQKQPFPNVWKQSFFLDPRAVQRERRRAARAVTRYVRHTCDKRAALFPGT